MHQKLSSAGSITQTLDMVWLELTSFCNLECIHCYANSGPTGKHAALSEEKYREIISEAADLQCERLQFIGGEPTAFKALPSLISHARMSGIRSIEVFTNATLLSEKIVNCFSANNVHVFVSFYSFDPTVHDAITKHSGSFQRTVAGISRLLELNIPTTVCVIEMDLNRGHFDATKLFLNRIGVRHVHFDAIRKFGRGISDEIPSERNASACEADVAFGELCGQCGNGKLAVLPDGTVSPCVMARSRVVGSALDTPLNALLLSPQLQEFRTELKKVREDRVAHGVQGTDVIEFPDRRGGGQSQSNLGGSELVRSRESPRLEECGPNTNTDPMCSPGTPQPEQCSPDTNTVPMCSPGTPQPEQCSPDTNTVPMCSPGTPQPEQCSPHTNTEPMCSPGTPQPEQCSPHTNTEPMCSPGTPQPEQCSPDTNTVPMCSPGTPQPEQCSPHTNTEPMCSPGTPQPEQCGPNTDTGPMCSPGTPQPQASQFKSGEGAIVEPIGDLFAKFQSRSSPIVVESAATNSEIYSFSLFDGDFCNKLVSIIANLSYKTSVVASGVSLNYRKSEDLISNENYRLIEKHFKESALPILNGITRSIWSWDCNEIVDLSVLRYDAGSYFKEHIDAYDAKSQARRHLTFIVYLSDDFEGGETHFRRQGQTISPRRGNALLFPSGITHPHEGKIVRSGTKFAIVGWLARL